MIHNIGDLFYPLGNRVCPIYQSRSESWGHILIGTAVPLIINKKYYMVTAAHVLNEVRRGRIITSGAESLIEFPVNYRSIGYIKNESIDVDIALMEIPNEATVQLLSRFHFTTVDELGTVAPYDKWTLYGFVGYPGEKNPRPQRGDALRRATPMFFVMRDFARIDKYFGDGKRENVHCGFSLDISKIRDVHFRPGVAFDPHGMSGGGIWQIQIDPNTGRVSAPKLVGIGIEYHEADATLVFTRIHCVILLFDEFYEFMKNASEPPAPC